MGPLVFLSKALFRYCALIFVFNSIPMGVKDTKMCEKLPKRAITFVVCGIAFTASLLFGTDIGILWVDSVEFYISLA